MIGAKQWLALGCALAALAAGPVSAQGNLKIGYVSVQRLVQSSPQLEVANKKLTDEFGPRQRDITAMEQKLRTQQETFNRDAPVMSEEERNNLQRQIRDATRDFERTRNEALEDFDVRQNEELNKVQNDVLVKVQEFARAEQYDLVLTSAVFFSTAVDITDDVLAKLRPAAAAPAAAPAPAPSGR